MLCTHSMNTVLKRLKIRVLRETIVETIVETRIDADVD